jgi:hypothetical protein
MQRYYLRIRATADNSAPVEGDAILTCDDGGRLLLLRTDAQDEATGRL